MEQKGTGFVPPPSPGAVRQGRAPTRTASLLMQCPLQRGRAIVPRGSQAPGAMQGPLLWAGWLLATGCLLGATGSCRHRCCPGRNNACWAPGARRARCYCDSYCQRTGDCCQDYPTSCRRAGECPRGWMAPARPRLGTPTSAAVLGGECLLAPVSPIL